MGKAFQKKGRTTWLIKYKVDGNWVQESTGVTDEDEANRILRQREADLDKGIPVTPAIGKVRWEEAVKDLVIDYQNNDQSLKALSKVHLHLTPAFTGRRLASITPAEIKEYTARRRQETYVPGTRVRAGVVIAEGRGQPKCYSNAQVNRELAMLKRIFELAMENGKLVHRPHIELLRENNVRKGFFSPEDFESVRTRLAHPLDKIATFAYLTGWRIDSEVLPLEWSHVDFDLGEVRIWAGDDKNDAGRVFPMTDDLRALLLEQWKEHQALRKAGHICPSVFVRMIAKGRGGLSKQHRAWREVPVVPRPVRGFAKAWKNACVEAGVPGRLPHDFRRTMARAAVRRGVPERVVMKLAGWKTRSVFDRYQIVSEPDLRAAVASLNGQLPKRAKRGRRVTKQVTKFRPTPKGA